VTTRSFRLGLAFRTARAIFALTLLLGVVAVLALRTLLYRQLDGTLAQLAAVEAQAGAARKGSKFEFHEGVLLAASAGPSAELTRYAQLWTSDGEPLIRSSNLSADLTLPAGAVQAARAGRIIWDTHEWHGQRLRCVVYPLELVGMAHEQHLLQVAAPLAPLEGTLRAFVLFGLMMTVFAVGAAFAVGWRIAGVALGPVSEITAQAEAIREGTPSPAISAHADMEEFARLVSVLNGMLGRLDRASALQRRFTADASHELRGPLTALRGDLELTLKRDRSPDEYRATLQRCREEVMRLTRVASDLLTLAQSEAGLTPQDVTEVDLRELADRVAARYGAVSAVRKIRFAISGPCVSVPGDPALLERVIRNLVDNAVKHSPEGGTVGIGFEEGAVAIVTVRDEGPGIPAADQGQLFNRFFRGQTQDGSSESTGLGLAIAKAAAESHGGRLEYAGNDPGAVFRLTLPLAVRTS
jgi:two-component system OmpR family sensor kinase